jgi:cyclophilin family peptidyl-prolyl cis-trans isomerase
MSPLLWVPLLLLAGSQAAPVRLVLEAPEKVVHPGRRIPLRVTIENASGSEAKLDEPDAWLEGLEISDPEGRVVKNVGKTKGIAKRSVPVEAGGFIGRTIDIGPAFPASAAEQEGLYRLRWSFGEAVSNDVQVYLIRDWIAAIETNHGTIEIEFRPDLAPLHVQSFLARCREGFYEGSSFHRIIPGFMMQGGAPKDPARDSKKTIPAEFSSAKHVFGTVSMARGKDPHSATTQFFICFGAVPHLDANYSIFGQVIAGDEVVKAVERVKSDHSPCKTCGKLSPRGGATPCCGAHHEDRPEQEVVIKKVTVSERKK